jgi:hypothetical protein
LACLLLVTAKASASSSTQAEVSVDWRGVADADIARCGLSRLRAGTIERLVADGHALVDRIGASGVAVVVASVPQGLQVDVASSDLVRSRTLAIADDCDATFVLEAISHIAALVNEVARARAPPQQPSASGLPSPSPRLFGGLDFTLRVSSAGSPLFGGGLGVGLRWTNGFEAGLRAELGGGGSQGVTVIEGFAALTTAWQPATSVVGLYLEAGPVLHDASSDNRSLTEFGGAAAMGPRLRVGHFVASLLAVARLRRFEHRVDTEKAFDSGHFGLVARIGGQLPRF